ncbi:nociceptin receptor-like [Patiria miniata]|uniref:G-protein coupled receptors family 1 profile domain-containing protein n=1 Tax=Patiria miniata TaxID=46514 RepID=A0A913Z7M3_PATMI|nr:nociceptin receptor-like [Patiria miniata]
MHEDTNIAIQREVVKYMTPIGLLMNAIFLYVVARIKSMHSIVNIYLGNLAAADTVILASSLVSLLWQTRSIWRDLILVSLANVSTFASHFFVTALAFERYFAICRPLTFRAEAGKGRAFKITAGLWVTAIVVGFAVTAAFVWGGDAGSNATNVVTMVHYTVGLVINVYLYVCIVKKLRQQPKITSSDDHQQRLRRVILMLIVNTAVFFALNITSIIEAIMVAIIAWSSLSYSSLVKLNHSWIDLVIVVFILGLFNSSVNPLVYSGVNSDYREALVEAFSFLNPKRYCCRNRDTTQRPAQQIEMQEIKPRHGRAAAGNEV